MTLYTERAEIIAQFRWAQDRLNTTLSIAPSLGISAINIISDHKLVHLREEVVQLRGRVVRLEGSPEQPEIEATLSRLREQFSESEAHLTSYGNNPMDDHALSIL